MIIGQAMFIYISICLYMWMVDAILDGHVLFQVVTLRFLAIIFSFTCCITCHLESPFFMDIHLFTYTCCTPRIAKFRGSFYLNICKWCVDDHHWNSNSLHILRGAIHKFWGSKALNSFILIKASFGCHQLPKRGRLKVHLPPMWVLVHWWHPN